MTRRREAFAKAKSAGDQRAAANASRSASPSFKASLAEKLKARIKLASERSKERQRAANAAFDKGAATARKTGQWDHADALALNNARRSADRAAKVERFHKKRLKRLKASG
jgi:hypothetical protein